MYQPLSIFGGAICLRSIYKRLSVNQMFEESSNDPCCKTTRLYTELLYLGEPRDSDPVHPDRLVPGAASLLRRPAGHRHGRAHHAHRSPRLSRWRRLEVQAQVVHQNHG